jgi:hypothetical protein
MLRKSLTRRTTLCTTRFTAHIYCVLQLSLHTYIVDSISDTLCSINVARQVRDF